MPYSDSSRSSGLLIQGPFPPYSPPLSEADTAVDPLPRPSSNACKCTRQNCKGKIKFDFGDERDPAGRLDEPCHGYPELAYLIVKHPGFESFQVFRDLQIKSLLYYQAQLAELRERLHKVEWDDHRSGTGKAETWCADITTLMEPEEGEDTEQIDLIKEIRGVLKEYNKALLRYAQINELPVADEFNVEGLCTWLKEPKLGNFPIKGAGQGVWGPLSGKGLKAHKTLKENLVHMLRSLTIFWPETPSEEELKYKPDLIVPRKKKEEDGLTQWIANDWLPFWHSLRDTLTTHSEKADQTTSNEKKARRFSMSSATLTLVKWSSNLSGTIRHMSSLFSQRSDSRDASNNRPTLETYSMSRMRRFASFVTTVVACLLPTAAIAVLATIHSQAKLIGFIALFTAIFAIGLMGLAGAGTSRTDIFTATAAFSAVLVVFVQNNQQSGSNGSDGTQQMGKFRN